MRAQNLLAVLVLFRKRTTPPRVCTAVTAEQQSEQSELSSDQLKQAAVSGVRWFAAAKASTEVLQLAAAIALARLVSPADFGNASVALIFLPLSVILTYEGFGSAPSQRQSERRLLDGDRAGRLL